MTLDTCPSSAAPDIVPIPRSSSSIYPQLADHPVGQRIANLYRNRISQFTTAGQYEHQNLLSALAEETATGEPHVKLSVYSVPDLARPTFQDATAHEFIPTCVGESFGPSWSTHWFKIQITVPPALCDKELLELHWDAGNEGMVWSADGRPLQGLTGGGERIEWILPAAFRDGKPRVIFVEMACNGMFGCGPAHDKTQPPEPNLSYRLTKADIVAVDVEARHLLVDMRVIGDVAIEFPSDSWEQHHALMIVNKIIDTFRVGDRDSIAECRRIAKQFLGPKSDSAAIYSSSTLNEKNNRALVYAIGHCHIDSCWLWPWAETRRKVARSWSNQCDLLDRYPEHRFVCSQAQQYQWLKEDYPSIFERVKEKVNQGTFQPTGGSWVEHDTNMPNGESLVRQFVYGQRFFESNFGARCKTFWLPDTFGYAAQIPQLSRLAGMQRFLTQKLSWNNINKFPHTTFNWVALDGSQVICHMPPSDTYNAEANVGELRRSVTQHKSMDQDPTSLLVFGKGDGGGGPTWQHLEKLRRCRSISENSTDQLPRVQIAPSVDDFFERLEKRIATEGLELVTWYGELYFEYHRGTYTSQAKNKRNNRRVEFLLRDLELLATVASLQDPAYTYPKTELDQMWQSALLCQFHDCLPGSSIEVCYDDSDEVYDFVFRTGKKLMDDLYRALGLSDDLTATPEGSIVALNTLPWPRNEILELPSGDGVSIACSEATLLPAVTPFNATAIPEVSVKQVDHDVFVLENAHLRVEVRRGVITSLYDRRAQRETIPDGKKANQFVIFDDKPLAQQAWIVEVFHLDTRQELRNSSTRIAESLPHRVSVVTETKISGQSWITTTISLSAAAEGPGSRPSLMEVTADIEWHETMKFLKVEFPVNVRNTEVSYEMQYGIIKRPTHYNTTWDMAKFEVICHKFADLSEHNYGVSILNDSKYGFATVGNTMRLSLIRSPKAPDAHADMGHHRIRWAILPHAGSLDEETVRAGFEFNNPLKLVKATNFPFEMPVRLTGDGSLVLDAVKRGEDDEDVAGTYDENLPKRKGKSVIVRVYDSLGGTSRGIIQTKLDVKRVFRTNLLEDDEDEVEVKNGSFGIQLRPFEVATWRLQL